MSNSICFVAGKSGGHTIPCITRARQYKEQHPTATVLFFTTTLALDRTLVQQNDAIDIPVYLPLTSVSATPWYAIITNGIDFMRSWFTSIRLLARHRPRKVITTGGFIALPVCYAAWMLGIPIELCELNVVPGAAIKHLARYATQITICFKKTATLLAPYPCTLSTYPHRFTQSDTLTTQSADNTKKRILILGGSQGSLSINRLIQQMTEQPTWSSEQYAIIHQTGSDQQTAYFTEYYKTHGIQAQVFSFAADLAPIYRQADIVIARAGAGTLFELLFFEKPCILIPLEHEAQGHQVCNAQEMVIEHQRLFSMARQKQLEEHPALLLSLVTEKLVA